MLLRLAWHGTKQTRAELARWLGQDWLFQDLDAWKQRGFYAHLADGSSLQAPNDATDPEFAATVVQFGNVLINFIDFPLRDSFSRYRELLEGVRAELVGGRISAPSGARRAGAWRSFSVSHPRNQNDAT